MRGVDSHISDYLGFPRGFPMIIHVLLRLNVLLHRRGRMTCNHIVRFPLSLAPVYHPFRVLRRLMPLSSQRQDALAKT